MRARVNLAALGRSKWYEYFVRFAFGSAVTVLSGVVAKKYGPEIGGLFLAFPAIFPATATLLEKHETQKENSVMRARALAGIDAAGASMGSIGLMGFAILLWQGAPRYSFIAVLGAASIGWLVISLALWWARKTWLRHLRLELRMLLNSENKDI